MHSNQRGLDPSKPPSPSPSDKRPTAWCNPSLHLWGPLSPHPVRLTQNSCGPQSLEPAPLCLAHASHFPPITLPSTGSQKMGFGPRVQLWGSPAGTRWLRARTDSRKCPDDKGFGHHLLQSGLGQGDGGSWWPNEKQVPGLGPGLCGKPFTSHWAGGGHQVCLSFLVYI